MVIKYDDYGNLSFLDLLAVASFVIGLQNLELNITQEDMDTQTADLDARVNDTIKKALADIHTHLEMQDEKIDEILRRLRIL